MDQHFLKNSLYSHYNQFLLNSHGKTHQNHPCFAILSCLFSLPYGFYQFVRFAALIAFVVLVYRAYVQERYTEMVIYGILALLFQPFFKFALGRTMWNIVDVVVGLGLIASIWLLNDKTEKEIPSKQ